ncbi:hypothetical protein N0V90_011952 [Kalmusia sp. IMI 367209]|nr:hypothetical protein N0V90_011952 [Kalmusia sp. IMI 367209]
MPISAIDYDSRSTASSKSTSLASSDGSVSRESKTSATTKKKKSGVLNFLTLKEPSQIALEQFADSQRKQTAAKGGPTNTVGFQGISPQKLPPSVPKVNSKWDGVPESRKSSRNSTISSKRDSSSSQGWQSQFTRSYTLDSSVLSVASNDSRGPPNSLASPMHSMADFREYMHSKTLQTPSQSDSASTASLPEMTYFFPDDLGASPVSSAEHPWSPPSDPLQANRDTSLASITEFDDKLTISEPNTVTYDDVDAVFRKLKGESEAAQEFHFGAKEDDADVPETHEFLFNENPVLVEPPTTRVAPRQTTGPNPPAVKIPTGAPPAANFSRPRPNQHPHHHKSAPAMPTLYEVSIASTDDTVTDSAELDRTDSRDSTDSSTAPSIAPSTAPSVATSFNPSVMSASWYRSPRERLGLGGRIRKNDVLPWEGQVEQAHPGKAKKSRLSVFSRG